MAVHPLLANAVDFELRFCLEVLKLESFHLGYSDSETEVIDSLSALRSAQATYTRSIVEWIPSAPSTILDVGCGIGDVDLALEKAGHIVHGLSPEKQHKPYFRNTHPESRFIHSGIETFTPTMQYDVLLMSESNNYFTLQDGMSAILRCVKPGGHALISGFFRTSDDPLINSNMVYRSDFEKECTHYGFHVIRSENMSHKIIPTLRFTESLFRNYMLPTLRIVQDLMLGFSPTLRFLLGTVFKRMSNFLEILEKWYDANLSEGFFRENMTYHAYLIQVPEKK
ncbi:MAG: class I SAM-dependent methyltransferase [Candidatus Kapaibacteriota bacterium]